MPHRLTEHDQYPPGTTVRSKAIGRKPAFDGVVVGPSPGVRGAGPCYRVGWLIRCPEGFHWRRTADELSLVPGEGGDAAP